MGGCVEEAGDMWGAMVSELIFPLRWLSHFSKLEEDSPKGESHESAPTRKIDAFPREGKMLH